MTFVLDERIASSCISLQDWPLSRVLLKNNAKYPWFILVPRFNHVQDIDQLSQLDRHQMIDEISKLSSIVRAYFKPDKLNVAALGNIVPQLHVHVIARFKQDDLWPHSIWQEALTDMPYQEALLHSLLNDLKPYL